MHIGASNATLLQNSYISRFPQHLVCAGRIVTRYSGYTPLGLQLRSAGNEKSAEPSWLTHSSEKEFHPLVEFPTKLSPLGANRRR